MGTKASETLIPGEPGGPNGDGLPIFVPGTSPAMRALERILSDIAPTDIPVLILGESGTGKQVVALEIHRRSAHSEQPFMKVNCGALTPQTLKDRPYLSGEGANGNGSGPFHGTLFLDNINELDESCQANLLHPQPDGDEPFEGPRPATRLISASSRDLEDLMRHGRFRQELYYRINGVCLRLPPLRDCKEDIPLLADFFLRKYAQLFGRPYLPLTSRTVQALEEHSWPGNIRELENTIKKIVAMGDERAALRELEPNGPEPRPTNGGGVSLKDAARAASRQAERELILKVLGRTRWNRKRAAQELQISYKALLYKLKQIGLDEPNLG
jgi:DNA-binding NtrC family response regulator